MTTMKALRNVYRARFKTDSGPGFRVFVERSPGAANFAARSRSFLNLCSAIDEPDAKHETPRPWKKGRRPTAFDWVFSTLSKKRRGDLTSNYRDKHVTFSGPGFKSWARTHGALLRKEQASPKIEKILG
jgi:hypothetical protein